MDKSDPGSESQGLFQILMSQPGLSHNFIKTRAADAVYVVISHGSCLSTWSLINTVCLDQPPAIKQLPGATVERQNTKHPSAYFIREFELLISFWLPCSNEPRTGSAHCTLQQVSVCLLIDCTYPQSVKVTSHCKQLPRHGS